MSFQITPTLVTNADGSESVSYSDATIDDSHSREYMGSRGILSEGLEFDEATGEYNYLTESQVNPDAAPESPVYSNVSTGKEIAEYYLSNGRVSDADFQALIDAHDDGRISSDEYDLHLQLLSLREGSLKPSDLSPEAYDTWQALMAELGYQLDNTSPEEDTSDDVSEEAITEEISSLQEAYPETDLVQDFMAAAVSAESEAEQVLYSLAAEFHAGRLSADEAINQAFNSLPQDQLINAYRLIQQR
jgi:hypothetical protein